MTIVNDKLDAVLDIKKSSEDLVEQINHFFIKDVTNISENEIKQDSDACTNKPGSGCSCWGEWDCHDLELPEADTPSVKG